MQYSQAPPDPLATLRSRPPSSNSSFRPPPPISPSPLHHQASQSSQPRYYPIPSHAPPVSSQYRPMNDPFSRSFTRSSSNTPRYETPPLSSSQQSASRPHPSIQQTASRSSRVDHFRPESRGSTRPESRASTSDEGGNNSIGNASTPRSAQEIYSQSREKKITGVDKILAKLTELTEDNRKQNIAFNRKIDGLSNNITKLANDITTVKADITNLKGDNTTLKADNRQLRDQVHELQLGQRSLATRDEIVEEVTNQVCPVLNENLQNYIKNLETLPENIASLSASKMQAILPPSTSSVDKPSRSDVALTNLLNHVVTKLNGIDKLIILLQSFQDLPEAITDVAVFKNAIDALTAKVDDFSQQQSQPASQPIMTNARLPPTPTSPVSFQLASQLEKIIETLDLLKETAQNHTTSHGQIKAMIKSLQSTLDSTSATSRPASYQNKNPEQTLEQFESTQKSSLDDLANAAFEASQVENQPCKPPHMQAGNISAYPSSSRLDQSSQHTYNPFSFQALMDPATLQSPLLPFSQPYLSINSITPVTEQGSSFMVDTNLMSGHSLPQPSDVAPIAPTFRSAPSPSGSKSRSPLSTPGSQSSKRTKFSPHPSDRPVTRSMSNQLREPVKWNPSSHLPMATTTTGSSIPIAESETSHRDIPKGRSRAEPIEVSSGSSSSLPNKPTMPLKRTVSKKKGRPSGRGKVSRNLEESALWSRNSSNTQEDSLNSGIDSLPSNDSVPVPDPNIFKKPPLHTYGSSTLSGSSSTSVKEPASRARAREMEEQRNKRRMSSMPTLGSAVGMPMTGREKGKRKVDLSFDESF